MKNNAFQMTLRKTANNLLCLLKLIGMNINDGTEEGRIICVRWYHICIHLHVFPLACINVHTSKTGANVYYVTLKLAYEFPSNLACIFSNIA